MAVVDLEAITVDIQDADSDGKTTMLNFDSIRTAIGKSFATWRPAPTSELRSIRTLELETLEDRMMLSSVTLQAGNVVEVIGTNKSDHIEIKDVGKRVRVTMTTQGHTSITKLDVRVPERIIVHGLNGNDTIINDTTAILEAYGGGGKDSIYGGNKNDELHGGPGEDRLFGLKGADLLMGDDAADLLDGGRGDDVMYGGKHSDLLFGMSGDDRMFGDEGNDVLRGGHGNDRINGDRGRDKVYGQEGHDELHGDRGCFDCFSNGQFIFVGEPDQVYGGEGNDKIFGNGGNDLLYGHAGEDLINGHHGNDRIFGNGDHDDIFGGGGDNRIRAGAGDDRVVGGTGNDTILGEKGKDEIRGGDGKDKIFGGSDEDRLFGEEGDDELYGEQGTDYLEGGNGNDNLSGGRSNDKFDGGDTLNGGAGNDRLKGYYGDDILIGESGSDRMYGSFGADYFYGGDDRDYMYGGNGRDMMYGGNGNDYIDGGRHFDTLMGGAGDDRLHGKQNGDILKGEAGNDYLAGDTANDKNGGRDELYGGTGNDMLLGMYGNDRLFGEAGNDILRGGYGNDYLTDNFGPENNLSGGPGNDEIRYLFEPGALHATIRKDGKALELAGTDEDFLDSEFTFLTTGSNRWTVKKNGSRFDYEADGTLYLDLDGNDRLDRNKDMLLSQDGLKIYSYAAANADEAIIDPASLDVDLYGNGLRNFLQSVKQTTGLGIKLPELRFGIASGQELRLNDDSLPLRDSQPYLFFTVNTGFGLKFGSASLTAPTPGAAFTVVVDPTDMFFYAKGEFDFKKVDVAVGVGYSEKGRIPFRPNAELEQWEGKLYGNLFIELNGIPLPHGFSVDGSLTVDLDANDDGNMLIDPQKDMSDLAPGGRFYDRMVDAAKDLKVGVNGTLNWGANFKKKVKSEFLKKMFDEIQVSGKVELAEGAVVYDGLLEGIHFKGQTVNPFKNTPLEKLEFLVGKKELSGSVTGFSSAPQFQLKYVDSIGGSFVGRTNEILLNNQGASFVGTTTVLGQSIVVSGGIKFDGTIYLRGTAQASVGSMYSEETGGAGAGLYFDIHGVASIKDAQFTVTAKLDVWANAITYGLFNVKTGFAADLQLTGRLELGRNNSVSLSARADMALYVVGIRFGVNPSLSITVAPNRFSFYVGPHEVVVRW